MYNAKDFANRDVSNLLICDYATGAPFINLDYANVTTTELTGEVVYAYGGWGHPRKIAFSGDRGGTMTIETQIQETKLYKLITGADVVSGSNDIQLAERTFVGLESTNKVFYLEKKPKADTTITIHKNGAAVDVTSLTVAETATDAGKWKVTVVSAGLSDGDEIVAFYTNTAATSERIAVKADTFPKAVIIYADTWDKSPDDSIISQKMIVYKAVAQPNFSLSNQNTGDPVSLTMTFDLMEDANHDILDLIFEDGKDTAAAYKRW